MKAFEHVNMFNHGITEVQDALHTNDNPPAEFNVNLVTAFSVILKDDAATYEESIEKVNLDIACSQLVPNLDQEVKVLIASMEGGKKPLQSSNLDFNLDHNLDSNLDRKVRDISRRCTYIPLLNPS